MFGMFILVPVQFFVHNWRASEMVTGFAYVLLLVVAALSLIALRFGPLGWALLAVFLHSLVMHG
jgi:hypothetical protein